MTNAFCRRTARKIRKFGYAKEVAVRSSRFMYFWMLSVSGIIAGMLWRTWQRTLFDDTSRALRHTLAWLIVAQSEITGSGTSSGPRAVDESALSFHIHRH